jgi:hypothetical protein
MKKHFSFLWLIGLIVITSVIPTLTLAAGNDVTLTTDAVLSVGGYTLDVTGSSATVQSIVVNPTNFVVTLASGSSLQVTSPTFNQLTTDIGTFTTSNTCAGNSSALTLASSGGTGTVTVTPTTTLCSATVSNHPIVVNGNGPIVGSLASPQKVPVIAPSTVSSTSSIQTLSTSTFFLHDLKLGQTGSDIRALQQYLNTHGFIIATTGFGSPGHETTKFGPATQKGLKALQKSLGLPATGFFGPMTRAKINK